MHQRFICTLYHRSSVLPTCALLNRGSRRFISFVVVELRVPLFSSTHVASTTASTQVDCSGGLNGISSASCCFGPDAARTYGLIATLFSSVWEKVLLGAPCTRAAKLFKKQSVAGPTVAKVNSKCTAAAVCVVEKHRVTVVLCLEKTMALEAAQSSSISIEIYAAIAVLVARGTLS